MRNKLFLSSILILLAVVVVARPSLAQSQPPGCSATGVGLSVIAYRADGVTPIPGEFVTDGELIFYQATLLALPAPNCFFEGGTLVIDLPDGTTADVTPVGGIPTVTDVTPFVSQQVPYVVSLDDATTIPQDLLNLHVIATARYQNGTSLLGNGITPVGAITPIEIHVLQESLNITKTAQPLVGREIVWNITKSVDPDAHNLTENGTGVSNYTIELNKVVSETNFSVTGNITILNPSVTSTANITGVVDDVDGVVADVECGVTFPYSLAPGGTLTCTYVAELPDNATRTNVVTVETSGALSGGNATAGVDFANAILSETGYDEVTVNDTNGLSWNFSDSGVEVYPYNFTCEDVNFTNGTATYTHPNTATILETGQSDDALVTVVCTEDREEGCTLTQGYWKTHSELGPAPYDDTWAELPSGAGTTFFLSGKTYIQVFRTPVAGNAYYSLAHQYMAAQLNMLAGADVPANVQDAFDDATALFNTYTPDQIKALKGSNAIRQQFVSLAGILGSYNEGAIGPGHCEEVVNGVA